MRDDARLPSGRRASGGLEPGGPGRIDGGDTEDEPGPALGGDGGDGQGPPQLGEELVALAAVARLAGGHDVAPLVATTTRARDHVVDRVAAPVAVGAAATVTGHQVPAVQRQRRPVRDPDV